MNKRNDPFVCLGCNKDILPAQKTSRNHCPYCFLCLHVDDDMPGDRKSSCQGKMIPLFYEHANGTTKITFECVLCKKHHRNKLASDDEIVNLDEKIKMRKGKFIHRFDT